MTRLVLLPGLGTTGRLFDPQRRAFPALEAPPWLEPGRAETLPDYGRRMAATLGPQAGDLVLGGVSFGGMVAMEMARHLSARAVVLIASCTTRRALTRLAHGLARIGRPLPARALPPPRPLWPVVAWAFGARTAEDRALVYELIRTSRPGFAKWGLRALMDWDPQGPEPCPVRRIHGLDDRLIGAARVPAEVVIPGAGHLINVTHAADVNAFVRAVLDGVTLRAPAPGHAAQGASRRTAERDRDAAPGVSVPPVLKTPRLVLRPMSSADAGALYRQWNDPRVGRFLWDGEPVARERVDEVIAASAASFEARGFGLWTAVLREEQRTAGFSGLRIEAGTGRVELLYAFDSALWGRGLATEAARAALADAFTRLRLPVVYAGTNPANEASWRVLERIGMKRIGTRRTPVEELLIYAIERAQNRDTAMTTLPSFARLATQLDAVPELLGDATPQALLRKSPSGKWSAHENLAHLGRQQEVFLERVRRILAEDAPVLPQYRAEDDPDWPAWIARPTDEVLRRLHSARAELTALLGGLTPTELARTGVHSRFGPMALPRWVEFFLVHEAHHLYVVLKRVHGAD